MNKRNLIHNFFTILLDDNKIMFKNKFYMFSKVFIFLLFYWS